MFAEIPTWARPVPGLDTVKAAQASNTTLVRCFILQPFFSDLAGKWAAIIPTAMHLPKLLNAFWLFIFYNLFNYRLDQCAAHGGKCAHIVWGASFDLWKPAVGAILWV